MGVLSVPVCGYSLVIPDGGGLCVADVTWLSCVVGGVDEQRLYGEGLQVPPLKVRHILSAEEDEGEMGKAKGVKTKIKKIKDVIGISVIYFQ